MFFWKVKSRMCDVCCLVFRRFHVFVVVLGRSTVSPLPALPSNPDEVYDFLLSGSRVFDVANVYMQVDLGNVPPAAYIAAEVNSSVFSGSTYLFQAGTGAVSTNEFGDRYVNAPLLEEYVYTVFLRGYVNQAARRRKRNTQQVRHTSRPICRKLTIYCLFKPIAFKCQWAVLLGCLRYAAPCCMSLPNIVFISTSAQLWWCRQASLVRMLCAHCAVANTSIAERYFSHSLRFFLLQLL